MGGVLDELNTRLKEKALGEKIPDGNVVPDRSAIAIEKWLTVVGLDWLAAEKKKKRQWWHKAETKDATPSASENKEQQEVIKQLEKAKKAANTTTAMAQYTDPAEAIVSLFPGLGDAGASITLAAYYHYLGKTVWFSRKQHKKINTILAIDGTVWFVPVIGDILDFFYKGCKKIAKLFVKHYEDLATKAKDKGVSAEVLDKIAKNEDVDEEAIGKRKEGKGRETIPDGEFDADGDGVPDDVEYTDYEDVTPKVDVVSEVTPDLPPGPASSVS